MRDQEIEAVVELLKHHFPTLEIEFNSCEVEALGPDGELNIMVATLGDYYVQVEILDGTPVFHREFETLKQLDEVLREARPTIASRLQKIISVIGVVR
jgi:hypothetical protein